MTTLFRIIYRLLLLAIAFCCTLPASASQTGRMFSDPSFTTGTYLGFCRDSDGFLWIATDSGLLKFDGNNYILYRHEENDPRSLSDSRLLNVISDSKGRIWATSSNGLNLYDPDSDSFKRIKLPSMSYDGYIIDICEQNDGTITFIVAGTGLYVVDESGDEPAAVRYMLNLPDETEHVCLSQNRQGHFYIGTRHGKVYSISPNGNPTSIDVADGYITDIEVEADGNILVSSVNDIYRIYPAEQNRVESIMSEDNARMHVNNFTRGIDDSVYFSTSCSGIWKIEAGKKTVQPCTQIYLPSIDLWNVKLGAIYADPEGNLWLGCHYKGIAYIPFNSIPFNYHPVAEALPDFKGGIDGFAVCDDKIILGYGNELGILSADGNRISQHRIPVKGTVCSIYPTKSDRILIGVSNDGIWEMSLPSGKLRRILTLPGKYPSMVMCELPGGELLVGFHGLGLMKYDPISQSRK